MKKLLENKLRKLVQKEIKSVLNEDSILYTSDKDRLKAFSNIINGWVDHITRYKLNNTNIGDVETKKIRAIISKLKTAERAMLSALELDK